MATVTHQDIQMQQTRKVNNSANSLREVITGGYLYIAEILNRNLLSLFSFYHISLEQILGKY